MLALWPDRLFVAISPIRIALLHTRCLFIERKIIAEKVYNLPLPENKHVDIPLIISTLAQLLSELNIQNGNLEVILSSSCVHMELLPPILQALKPEEQLKRVQLHFERIYGQIAKQWIYCTQPLKFNQQTLTSAIDQTLLSGLQKVAVANKLILGSVEPSTMVVLNQWEHLCKGTQSKFIIIEKTCCTIVNLNRYHITSTSQLMLKNTLTSNELQTILQRESLKLGESFQGKLLYLISPKNSALKLENSKVKLQYLNLPVLKSLTKYTRFRLLMLLGNI